MNQLVAAFAISAFCIQQPVHGADRAVIVAVVEQRGVDLCRGTVLKALLKKSSQYDGFSSLKDVNAFSVQPWKAGLGACLAIFAQRIEKVKLVRSRG